MTLECLSGPYTVCAVPSLQCVDWSGELTFVGKTDRELSLVCPTPLTPAQAIKREDGWRALRVAGELDFSLIGILSHITDVLARARVSVFCVSTYDTDSVLIKQTALDAALDALRAAGFTIR